MHWLDLSDHVFSRSFSIMHFGAFHTYTPLFDHNEWKFIDHIILHIIWAMHITEHLSIACKRISLPVKYLLSVSLKGKGGRYLFQYQIKRTRVTKQTIRKIVFFWMQSLISCSAHYRQNVQKVSISPESKNFKVVSEAQNYKFFASFDGFWLQLVILVWFVSVLPDIRQADGRVETIKYRHRCGDMSHYTPWQNAIKLDCHWIRICS